MKYEVAKLHSAESRQYQDYQGWVFNIGSPTLPCYYLYRMVFLLQETVSLVSHRFLSASCITRDNKLFLSFDTSPLELYVYGLH